MPPIDFLDEDIITVPGQLFALVSFVSPVSNVKWDKCAMKIRGVFATADEANRHCKKLMSMDNTFDVWVQPLYKWVLVPPDPSMAEDEQFVDEKLNEIMQAHKKSQMEAKQEFERRKREIMQKGLEAELTEEERIPRPPEAATTSTEVINSVFGSSDPHPAASGSSASAPGLSDPS